MTKITIEIMDADYHRLIKATEKLGKPIQVLIHEWISQLPEIEEPFDIREDPIFQMDGYDSDAPSDLSSNFDKYLYESNDRK